MGYRYVIRKHPMNRQRFEQLVAQALEALPTEFQEKLDNVDVVIEWWPTPDQIKRAGRRPQDLIFGLYEGVPLTHRTHHYGLVTPDRIIIFQGPIEMISQTDAEMRRTIRKTVLHEIGHHFGLSDQDLKELGY